MFPHLTGAPELMAATLSDIVPNWTNFILLRPFGISSAMQRLNDWPRGDFFLPTFEMLKAYTELRAERVVRRLIVYSLGNSASSYYHIL